MVDDTPLISGKRKEEGKQGHRVFCCCDSRKATIMVSLVALVLNILALIGRATVKPVDGWGIAAYSISVLFYFLVIWGTIRYHRCAVIISLIWQIVAVVFIVIGMVNFNWNSFDNQEDKRNQIIADSVILAWYLVVIYSLGTFSSEVSRGIMSPANHPREKYSCCCNV